MSTIRARHRIGQGTADTVLPAAAALLLGIFLLYGVGLAQPASLHEAAHDTRHVAAFPCH